MNLLSYGVYEPWCCTHILIQHTQMHTPSYSWFTFCENVLFFCSLQLIYTVIVNMYLQTLSSNMPSSLIWTWNTKLYFHFINIAKAKIKSGSDNDGAIEGEVLSMREVWMDIYLNERSAYWGVWGWAGDTKRDIIRSFSVWWKSIWQSDRKTWERGTDDDK